MLGWSTHQGSWYSLWVPGKGKERSETIFLRHVCSGWIQEYESQPGMTEKLMGPD